jgi:glycosyltransferase involved in cell wall biosynthesis
MMTDMRYVLITPARNEQRHLETTIRCVVSQTRLPIKWIIVNDGSTDLTADIIDRYAVQCPWIEKLDMPQHRDRSFAAKARCFNAAYDRIQQLDFEVIGNLDADVQFESDYCEFLLAQFQSDPSLGVAGTPFVEENYDSGRDSFEGAVHVPGGCQLFRRQCLVEVGGYIPNRAGGVDWIAVTTARMKGWNTRSFNEKRFIHNRPLGTAERSAFAGQFSYGEKDYYLGNHPLWEAVRIGYRTVRRPYLVGGLALLLGYAWAAMRRYERPVSRDLMRFHRGEQMRKLSAIARSLSRLERVNAYSLTTAPGTRETTRLEYQRELSHSSSDELR